jgi:hypothetical protein
VPTPNAPNANRSAKPSKRATTKGSDRTAAKCEPGRSPRYPEWMTDAVRRSRVLSGQKIGPDGNRLGDKTLSYPGPRQHLRIRDEVTRELGTVTPAAIVKAAGVNYRALKGIATWTASREAMKPFRPMSRRFADDSWATGRYCAAVLVAWIDQLRADAARSDRSLGPETPPND